MFSISPYDFDNHLFALHTGDLQARLITGVILSDSLKCLSLLVLIPCYFTPYAVSRSFISITIFWCYKSVFDAAEYTSRPTFDEFYEWLGTLTPPPKTGLCAAVIYARNQRKYLERYLEDGHLEISNNRAERSIKPFVIGRKNWLFANTPRGAKASAILFSIIETSKENGLNPYEYLTYIFTNAPNWDIRNNIDNLGQLLPWFVPNSCKAKK